MAPQIVPPSVGHQSLLRLGWLFQSDLPLPDLLHALLEQLPHMVPVAHAAIWMGSDLEQHCVAEVGAGAHKDTVAPPASRFSLGLPIVAGGERVGFLYAHGPDRAFTPDEVALLNVVTGFAGMAIENTRLRERQERVSRQHRLLDQIGEYLHQTLDLAELIDRLFGEVNKAICAQAQSIWLVNPDTETISCRFATGPGAEQVKQVTVPLGEGVVGSTVTRREPILVPDAQHDIRHSRRAQAKTGMVTHSLMSVPLVHNGRAIGAMQAINKFGQGTSHPLHFTPDDLELFGGIADIAALCIENARLYADLQASYDTTLEALAAALDARDRETEGHSRRVVEYTTLLARQRGFEQGDLRIVRRGALIHDIGKIGVPDGILHKPGPLTPDERQIMQKHPQTGWELLRDIPHLRREVQIVLTHQERWDGRGYPQGLAGEGIPLGARLFMIADTFDAITSDRPYRAARPYADAAHIIEAEAGKQFDPLAVEAFLSVSAAEWDGVRRRVHEETAHHTAPTTDAARLLHSLTSRP